jgi:hypothetical protein
VKIKRDPLMKKRTEKKSLDVIYLHAENKHRIEKLHEDAHLTNPTLKFHPFAESILVDFADLKESQKKFTYPIEFKAVVDRHIVLMDNLANKPVLVAMIDSKKILHCDSCDSDICQHVGFSYGNLSACKILAKMGFFTPKNGKSQI